MPHIFGAGRGHLSQRAIDRAEELGAEVVNHTDPQDSCGYGCKPFTCPKSKRHWFTLPEGNTSAQRAREILTQLRREGFVREE